VTRRLVRAVTIVLVVYAGLIGIAGVEFATTPTGFIPEQDQGYLINIIQLPPGATLDRTEKVFRRGIDIILGKKRKALSMSRPLPASTPRPPPFAQASEVPLAFAALKEAGAEQVFAKKQSGLRGAQRSPQWLGQPRDVGRNPARLVAPGPPCRSTSQTRLTISRCGSPQPFACPRDLSRSCCAVSGPVGHAVWSPSGTGEK
jgi:hypothetical protein